MLSHIVHTLDDKHYHQDDRGTRYLNIFSSYQEGATNITIVQPQTTICWHRHKFQKDFLFVPKGFLKVGLALSEDEHEWVYLSEKDLRVLEIPENTWHGIQNYTYEPTTLIYWVTKKYNSIEPDEERISAKEMGINWGKEIK